VCVCLLCVCVQSLQWRRERLWRALVVVENTDLVLILCANMMCYVNVRVCERGDDILSTLVEYSLRPRIRLPLASRPKKIAAGSAPTFSVGFIALFFR